MQRIGSWFLFLLGAISVVGVALWLRSGGGASAAPPPRPPFRLPVTTATVERGDLNPTVALTGTVIAGKRAALSFVLSGRVVSLEFEVGDEVRAGELLARLDSGDQEVALLRAQAAVALSERRLDLLLAGSRPEEIRRLSADLEVAQTAERLATKEVERGQELVAQKILSDSEFDVLVAERDASVGRVRAAEEALALAEAGTRPEDVEVQRAELALRQAEVAAAERECDKTELKAPFDGAVLAREASEGDTVAAGQSVLELASADARSIELEIPSRFAGQVVAPSELVLTLEEDPGFELRTELDALVFAADERTRNFRGRARLDEEEDSELRLRPGMFVRARLQLAAVESALLVPSDSVRTVRTGEIVVRAVASGPDAADVAAGTDGEGGTGAPGAGDAASQQAGWVAEWVPVRLISRGGDIVAVESLAAEGVRPLAEGDTIVVSGVDLAFPEMALRPSSRAQSEAGPAGEPEPEAEAEPEPDSDASGGSGADDGQIGGGGA